MSEQNPLIGFIWEVVINLVADLASDFLQKAGGPCIEKLRDATFMKRTLAKVVRRLCTGYTELKAAEAAERELLVVDEHFFSKPSVRYAFLESLITGTVSRDRLRKAYIALYGHETLDRFERNMEDAIALFQQELSQALTPAERAAFAKLQAQIEQSTERLSAELGRSTREVLTSEARTQEMVTEMGKGLHQQLDLVQRVLLLPSKDDDVSDEHQAQLEQARNLVREFQPNLALRHLHAFKERVWDKASRADKARILTIMGFAHLQLSEDAEAARWFIMALDLNPENARMLANAALGHLLKGERQQGRELARRALEIDPTSELATAMLVYASSTDNDWTSIVAAVPEPLRESVEVAVALGQIALKRQLLDDAEQWFRIACEYNTLNHPDPYGMLADVLLTRLLEEEAVWPVPGTVNPAESQLREIVALYDSAWGRVAHTDLRKLRLRWLANRATAKALLNDIEGAIHDVDEALIEQLDDAELIKSRAMLALRCGDLPKAASLFRQILDHPSVPEASFWFGLVLLEDDRLPEARDLLKAYAGQLAPTHPGKKEVTYILVLVYLRLNDLETAKKEANHLRDEFPGDPAVLTLWAQVAAAEGQQDEAQALLQEALVNVTPATSMVTRYRLAGQLYAQDQFEDSAHLLEAMVDTELDGEPTRQLLACYYQSGNLKPALEICRKLRQKHGPLRYVTEMESAIYEEIGEVQQAKHVCDEYLELYPDDTYVQLRRAVVCFRLREFDALDEVLDRGINTDDLNPEARTQLARLYLFRDRKREALQIAYETRWRFFDNSEAHLAYVNIYYRSKDDLNDWLNVDIVATDTAVRLDRSIATGQSWIIIQDTPGSDTGRGEFPSSHLLVQQLLGKAKGDTVAISYGSETEGFTIEEIKSKYMHVCHQSLEAYSHLFLGEPGIWRGKIKRSPEGDLDVQGLTDTIDHMHEHIQQAEQFYQEGKCTIGALAEMLGRNPIQVHATLMSNPDIGILCCRGDEAKRRAALGLLATRDRLILDITSLLTLHNLGVGDAVVAHFSKPGLMRTSLELIHHLLQHESFPKGTHWALGKEGGQIVKILVTAEQIEHNRRILEKMSTWAEANCEILPCRAALSVRREERLRFGHLIGPSFLETALVAADEGRLLYSDDWLFRELARTEYSVRSVWTQPILRHLLDKGVIDRDVYNRAVIALVCMNYHYTSTDATILLEASRMAEWRPAYPLLQVARVLGGKRSNLESAVRQAVEYLYLLWKEQILLTRYEVLIGMLLDSLATGRGPRTREAVQRFLAGVTQRFALAPLEIDRVTRIIKSWLRIHVL